MNIRRVLALAVAVATVCAASPALVAQQNNQQNRKEQEKRSQQEQQDIQALVRLVDAVQMGQQPAPTDVGITWEYNHFVKGVGRLDLHPVQPDDRSQQAREPERRDVCPRREQDSASARPRCGRRAQQRTRKISRASSTRGTTCTSSKCPASGKVSRAMAVKPGDYEVFITVKEATHERSAEECAAPEDRHAAQGRHRPRFRQA